MAAQTVRISETSHRILKTMAEQTGQSMMDVLDRALEAYRRKQFFDQMNAGYAELQAEPEAWAEHLAERKAWDATLMDGMEADETEDGRCVTREKDEPRGRQHRSQGKRDG